MPTPLPPSEARIQQDCVTWFRNTYRNHANLLYKNHNEGQKNIIAASIDKALGLTPGVPDLFLAIPNIKYYGLYIELKQPGKYLSKVQRERMTELHAQGYACICVKTIEDFKRLVDQYLTNPLLFNVSYVALKTTFLSNEQ